MARLVASYPNLDITLLGSHGRVAFRLTAKVVNGPEVVWRILPDQNMEKAFRTFLSAAATGDSELSKENRRRLKGLKSAPGIDIYAARWCDSSASAAAVAARVAVEEPRVALRILDAEGFDQSLLPIGLASVPLTIIGRKARLYGAYTEDELSSALMAFGEGRWERQTLLHMLAQKMRPEILQLVKSGLLSVESVAKLVGEDDLGVRMGAILLLSDLAGIDRGMAGEAFGTLVELLGVPEPQRKADAVYALAELGDIRALPYMDKLAMDTDPDLREGAVEARDKIKRFNILRN